jgi:hypothetical protein
VILSVEGITVGDEESAGRIRAAMAGLQDDDTLDVVVLRGGRTVELSGLGSLIR